MDADPNRIDRIAHVNSFELKRRVVWGLSPNGKGMAGLVLHVGGQSGQRSPKPLRGSGFHKDSSMFNVRP